MAEPERTDLTELVVAIIISLSALATSFATFEARLWSGRQVRHFGLAGAYRTIATHQALDASVSRSVDIDLFNAWLTAKHSGNAALAAAYQGRFPASLKPAFSAWLAQDPLDNPHAPPSPFVLASYQPPGLIGARQMEAKAQTEFESGEVANYNGNAFMQCAVILAMAMFFGGVGQVFRRRSVRAAMAVVALVACIVGLQQTLTLPMLALSEPLALSP
jgi:hypothetical protein